MLRRWGRGNGLAPRAAIGTIACAALCLGAPHRVAMAAPPAATPTPTQPTPEATARAGAIAASRMARLAVVALRNIDHPTQDDYRLAALLLEEAGRLAPRNEEILRRQIESWDAAGDQPKVLEKTRELLGLAPEDTVAQLRLITARVRDAQSVEGRRAMYGALLGPDGARLHPSVRSRLALDDALLARETGDDAGFVRRLTEALSLDPTNKEAAVLAATYSLPRITDPMARVELLANVVLADPLDHTAYLSLARELMRFGAFAAGKRFFDRATDLYAAAGLDREVDVRADMAIAAWATTGAEALVDQQNEDERVIRYILDLQRKNREKAGTDPSEVPEYTPVRALEWAQLIAASAVDREEDAARALANMAKAADDDLTKIADLAKDGTVSEDAALARSRGIRSELMWLRLWTGLELDKAKAEYDALRDSLTADARAIFEGWIALREANGARAVELLTPLAATDLRARLGLAVEAETRSDDRAATIEYARAVMMEPGAPPYPNAPMGLWARTRLERLLGDKIRPGPIAQALNDYVARLPHNFDAITSSPRAFMHLEAKQATASATGVDPVEIDVTLRNIGPVPLAVGPASPINSSLLLAPRLLVNGQQLVKESRPEVVSLDRRLSLLPGERISARVWGGQGDVGELLDQLSGDVTTLRWNVIQGFELVSGVYQPGLLCLSAETDLQRRRYPGDPGLPLEELAAKLSTARGVEFEELVLFARWRMFKLDIQERQTALRALDLSQTPDPKDRQAAIQAAAQAGAERAGAQYAPVADAIAARLPSLEEAEQVFALLETPPAFRWPGCRSVDEAALHVSTRASRMAMLMTRARHGDSPLFEDAVNGNDAVLAEFARVLRERRGGAGSPDQPAGEEPTSDQPEGDPSPP